jgi:hypothetical protein
MALVYDWIRGIVGGQTTEVLAVMCGMNALRCKVAVSHELDSRMWLGRSSPTARDLAVNHNMEQVTVSAWVTSMYFSTTSSRRTGGC